MRINLNCPYAEKDQAKSLGARWDAARKTWYIENVEDLTPFMRWVETEKPATQEKTITLREYLSLFYTPEVKSITFDAARVFGIPFPPEKGWAKRYADRRITYAAMDSIKRKVGKKVAKSLDRKGVSLNSRHNPDGFTTGPSTVAPDCGCGVLPWEDCQHSDAEADRAMREMLSLA